MVLAKSYSHEVRIVLTDKAIKALKARDSLYRVGRTPRACSKNSRASHVRDRSSI